MDKEEKIFHKEFTKLFYHKSSIICEKETVISGEVTIGQDCIVHPTAIIKALNGPISIGNKNIIEERATIINLSKERMIVGNLNVFEVDSYCSARKVGNNNLFEIKSHVGTNISINDNCIIGFCCRLEDLDSNVEAIGLPSNSVIYGNNLMRTNQDARMNPQVAQLDFLKKVLPNYHSRPDKKQIPAQQR